MQALKEQYNTVDKVEARQKIVSLQTAMEQGIDSGELENAVDKCLLQHYFVPDIKSGYFIYARELKMPKGAVVVGKIHKEETLNILSSGKISLVKDGIKIYLEAPHIYVSEPGIQKAAYIEEDVTWINIHITKHNSEKKLDKIEKEVIAESYEDIGLIASKEELNLLSDKDKGEVL